MNFFAGWLILYVVVNVIFSIPVAYVASQKGRSAAGFFFLSFFLSFIVGILVVLALPKASKIESSPYSDRVIRQDGELRVKCPFCAEWVNSEAKVCKHCGRDIETEIKETLSSITEQQAAHQLKEQEQRREAERQLTAKREQVQAKRKAFFKSRAGRTILIGSVCLVIVAIVVTSVQLITAEIARQEAEQRARQTQALVQKDCKIVEEQFFAYMANLKQSVAWDGSTVYYDFSKIATAAARDRATADLMMIIPELIAMDEEQATRPRNYDVDGYYDGQYSAEQLAKRVLYNQLIAGTSFEPAAVNGVRLDDTDFQPTELEACGAISEELFGAFYDAGSLGVLALKLRSCRLTGQFSYALPCN